MSVPAPAVHQPTRRADVPFSWRVSCGMPLYALLADVRFDRVFREADAVEQAYRVGRPRVEALLGPDVSYAGPGIAGISYGHVNCLGCPLIFPEDSEVAHRPVYDSLGEGIEALRQPVDWANAGDMPYYLELWGDVQRRFPEMDLGFGGFGVEGPLTTAWELRGHDFFTDLYDDRAACSEYLRLVTESVIDYVRFTRSVNGDPPQADGAGICDDIAAMVRPDLWPVYVLPHLERYFAALSTGARHAHIEDLVPDHLPHLDALRLDGFDPSVSPRLKPTDLRDRCRTVFAWRLTPMQVKDFDAAQTRRFVIDAVAGGASSVFCALVRDPLTDRLRGNVASFIETAKAVTARLAAGVPRSELAAALG